MARAAIWLASLLLLAGCGPHRITFRMPSNDGRPVDTVTRMHSHGIGPLLIGGGGYFFLIDEISPALVDYTGEVRTQDICPHGFAEVSHQHEFWQSALAAVISYGGMVNWWHPSNVEWKCLAPPSKRPVAAKPPTPESAGAPPSN